MLRTVVQVAEDIKAWKEREDVQESALSPYQSESFGGYSYAKAVQSDGTLGITWKSQAEFMTRLKPYRRIRVI